LYNGSGDSMFQNKYDNKRYLTLNNYYKGLFDKKVFKLSLNAGFTCPNIKNGHGCIFCSNKSGDFAGDVKKSLKEQYEDIKKMMHQKWSDGYYIAYFQVGTNTYAPLDKLKKDYEEVLTFDNIIGLSISTRPDSITDEVFDYLADLNKRTILTVELGLQSIHDKTLKLINRGHDLQVFEDCVKKLQERNITVVIHIINGLPDETKEDMIETVKYLNQLKIDGIKIHMLSIIKDTPLAELYEKNPFSLLSKEEYIDIVCEQLTYLKENIVIHRLTGDPNKEELVAPFWLIKKFVVLNDIDKEMKKRELYQGMNCK